MLARYSDAEFLEDRRTMSTVMKPEIALVIATYNRSAALSRLLANIESQALPKEQWEVIVGVDGSKDDTVELLKSWEARGTIPLRWFFQENAGQSVARHQGVLRSQADYIIIIDDDMKLAPDFIGAHLRALKAIPRNPVVIGKVLPQDGWERKPLYEAVREKQMIEQQAVLAAARFPPTATAFVTQNVSFAKALYVRSGGFDPSLRLDEDRELGMRFERLGGVFRYASEAWAVHLSDVGAYEKWRNRQYEYGKYAVEIWEKHGRDPYLHPLRNYVNGNKLNRLLVQCTAHSDFLVTSMSETFRRQGNLLHRLGLLELGTATHKAIQAMQYHLGVRHKLGSWQKVEQMAREFAEDVRSPKTASGEGATMSPQVLDAD